MENNNEMYREFLLDEEMEGEQYSLTGYQSNCSSPIAVPTEFSNLELEDEYSEEATYLEMKSMEMLSLITSSENINTTVEFALEEDFKFSKYSRKSFDNMKKSYDNEISYIENDFEFGFDEMKASEDDDECIFQLEL